MEGRSAGLELHMQAAGRVKDRASAHSRDQRGSWRQRLMIGARAETPQFLSCLVRMCRGGNQNALLIVVSLSRALR
jgi:hypothetical protein